MMIAKAATCSAPKHLATTPLFPQATRVSGLGGSSGMERSRRKECLRSSENYTTEQTADVSRRHDAAAADPRLI